MRDKPPTVPRETRETARQLIAASLVGRSLSARDISHEVHLSEKEVYDHLGHITRQKEYHLEIIPAACRRCGFVFHKRERLRKPGKCPVCRGELISEPLFTLTFRGGGKNS